MDEFSIEEGWAITPTAEDRRCPNRTVRRARTVRTPPGLFYRTVSQEQPAIALIFMLAVENESQNSTHQEPSVGAFGFAGTQWPLRLAFLP